MTERLARDLVLHVSYLALADARRYSVERRPTDFPHAAARLVVYDQEGVPAFEGHEFLNGHAAFWLKVGGDDRPPSWAPASGSRRPAF